MPSIVLVKWRDARDHNDKWVDEEDVISFGEDDPEVESMGYLVSRTSKYLTLAADFDPGDRDYGRVTKIPSSMLVSIENLVPAPRDPDPKTDS